MGELEFSSQTDEPWTTQFFHHRTLSQGSLFLEKEGKTDGAVAPGAWTCRLASF